jgi:hypothetical protein
MDYHDTSSEAVLPRPGYHTPSVLASIGYDLEQVAALVELGAIG